MLRSISLLSAVLSIAGAEQCPALDNVNSFIGTGGLGFGYGGVNPGAQTPSGPMRLGPDSTNTMANVGYRHFSGYNYLDDQIRMFSHTHTVGAGLNDLGNFGVMPVRVHNGHSSGDETEAMRSWLGLGNVRDSLEQHTRVWWSMFNKTTESASPGRYDVFLETPRAHASMLATGRSTAVHKYTFEADHSGTGVFEPAVVLDVCHASHLSDGLVRDQKCGIASLEISDDLQSFTATVFFSGKFWIYLYGEFGFSGIAPKKWTTCGNGDGQLSCSSDTRSASTENHFLFSRISFGPQPVSSDVVVELRVALSFISGEQAKKNFGAVDTSASFESLVKTTRQTWCDALSHLAITPLDGDLDIVPMLMSANYRVLMTPTDYTEEGGVYLGLDKAVHAVEEERNAMYPESTVSNPKSMQFYSDLSFWDTFRTLHPWILLTDESWAVGILRSVSEMTLQQNAFPKWVLANVDINCMIGLHGGATALEGALVGLDKEFDVYGIQQMLLHQATEHWPNNPRGSLDFYLSNGYVPQEDSDVSASITLSYAYDDYVLGGLSQFVGDLANAEAAFERAQNYRNLWSEEKEFICPRSNTGELLCPRNATAPEAWNMYKEGDGLHWSTFVMHDPKGLQSLYNSSEDFEEHMEIFFSKHVDYFNDWGNAAPNPYFWIGNEVDSFAMWLFNFDSDCTRAQYWSRNTSRAHFTNTPHGVPGNEDYGAMSSWLLFTTLGIFPQAGTTTFMIGSPGVANASLELSHLDGSKSMLEIVTENNSPQNMFVKSLKVNGESYYSPMIDRMVLAAPGGCKLEFVMSSEPVSDLCRR